MPLGIRPVQCSGLFPLSTVPESSAFAWKKVREPAGGGAFWAGSLPDSLRSLRLRWRLRPSVDIEGGCVRRILLAIGCTVKRIAILAGAFNPVTRAHLALANAASGVVDEVVCVVPQVYPPKDLEEGLVSISACRCFGALWGAITEVERTDGGLFVEIAREMRVREPRSEIHFVCGRDAAERILHWDYGEAGFAKRMLEEFGLLNPGRGGKEFVAPSGLGRRVRPLRLDEVR